MRRIGTSAAALLVAATVSAGRAGDLPMPPGTIGEMVDGRRPAPVTRVTVVSNIGDMLNLRGRGLTALPLDALRQTQIQALYLDGHALPRCPG